jgi:hypothetical protein
VVERARELAKQRGTSLNQMIRDYLRQLAADKTPEELIAELERHWATSGGNSGGQRWTREEIHDRSRFR